MVGAGDGAEVLGITGAFGQSTMVEVVEGKWVRKEEDTSHRSSRAPELFEALKWVKSEVEGLCRRQMSWRAGH